MIGTACLKPAQQTGGRFFTVEQVGGTIETNGCHAAADVRPDGLRENQSPRGHDRPNADLVGEMHIGHGGNMNDVFGGAQPVQSFLHFGRKRFGRPKVQRSEIIVFHSIASPASTT